MNHRPGFGTLTLNTRLESFKPLAAPVDKLERSVLKIVLGSIALLGLLIAAAVIGPRFYHRWQERRLVEQGTKLYEAGDYKRASLAARRVIQLNDKNVEACRLIAKLGERSGLESAVDWRQRVVDLIGPNPADLFPLVRDALQFNDVTTAERAFGKWPQESRATSEYHVLAAEIAAAQNDAAKMEQHLIEAVRLAPEDKSSRLRLAALRLTKPASAQRESGRATLLEMQKDPEFAKEATKQLLAGAVRGLDNSEAVRLAQQLLAFPDVTFADKVAALAALHRSFDQAYPTLLTQMKEEASKDGTKAGQLLTWMNSNQMASDAVTWSQTLPPEVLANRSVALALADTYTNNRDWEGMLKFLKTSNWGELDFVRLALMARALRETRLDVDSQKQWAAAVKAASARPGTQLMLADIVQRWNWADEAVELLWLVSKDRSRGEGALLTLYGYYAKNNDAQNLYRVLVHLREFRPDDRVIQNNLSQISLLLNLDVERAQKAARELYEGEPTNPAFASTYAFALFQRGDARKAVQILRNLPEAERQKPAVAAYYGIVLAAVGEKQEAAQYLQLAKPRELLPEERALIEKAQRALETSPSPSPAA
jgi:tetratricopeptide (TPR) repeat protein